MRKIVIILSVSVLIAGSCKQTMKAQNKSTDNIIIETQNTTTMEQTQNNYLNEVWLFVINDSARAETSLLHYFEPNGQYRFNSIEDFGIFRHEEANGTYYYQPETKEIFIHIKELRTSGIVGRWAVKKDYQEYLKILELNDTTVVVSTWAEGETVIWKVSEDGKYKLIEPKKAETIALISRRNNRNSQ